MSQTRVYAEIRVDGTTYALITSEDQIQELIQDWKQQAPTVCEISGTVDHRDANEITHYIVPSDIEAISVVEIKM